MSHLVFALKYEGVQLLTLKAAFAVIDAAALETAARATPASAYVRRICFLYEWLTGRILRIPDVTAGTYVDAIEIDLQYAVKAPINSKRFRVRDNLPGSAAFCPLVHRTREMDRLIGLDLAGRARAIVRDAPKDLLARAAAFLLLSDSKASFAIESETPPKDRIARWGHTIGKAGQVALSIDELVKLQRELIGDFLRYRDDFNRQATEIVDMPSRTIDTLLGFLRQNGGRLSEREFLALTESEVARVEAIFADLSV